MTDHVDDENETYDDDDAGEADEAYDDEHDEEDEEDEPEPWDLLSRALGSLDELESDEELALDVSERAETSSEPERFSKVPLAQAQNLIELRRLASGIKDGSITLDMYRARVKLMVRTLEEGIKVIRSETVVHRISELPPEQKVFFDQTARLIEALLEGGQHMLRYVESKSFSDMDQGLGIIEAAFQELDDMQSKAIEMGREIDLREATAGE